MLNLSGIASRGCWIGAVVIACAHSVQAQCTSNFAAAVGYPSNAGPYSVAIADLNGDGRPDVVVGYMTGGTISVYLNTGGGNLGLKTDFGTNGGGQIFSIALGRMNADTRPDIVCTTTSGLRVLLNNGSGGFGTAVAYAGASPLRQVVLADVNNDGFLDVVAASMNVPLGGVVLLNNHDGTLNQQPNLPVGTGCGGVGVLDFDTDGFPDVLLSASNGSGVHRFRGLGNGSFQNSSLAFGPAGGTGMALADLTGDGLPDVVMPGGSGQPVIYGAVNAGGGVFNPAPNTPEPGLGSALNVAVADVNGDGTPDLLAPLQGSNALAVHPGLGGASFGAGVTYSVGGGPTAVAVGDLNGDGAPDAVVTNGNGSTISVLLGIPLPVITTQPSPLTLSRGQTAVFTVAATGATSFAWRVNGTPLANGGHYSGVNTNTLTIIECTTVEAGNYDCVVGVGCQVTSNAAALTVNNCGLPDFNGDGDIGTDDDIAAFFRVLSGGGC